MRTALLRRSGWWPETVRAAHPTGTALSGSAKVERSQH